MSLAEFGSFSGAVTPGVNMLDIFRQNERTANPNSILNFGNMSLKKLSLTCPVGTRLKINGKDFTMMTNFFPEFSLGQVNITSLVFLDAVDANIIYYF